MYEWAMKFKLTVESISIKSASMKESRLSVIKPKSTKYNNIWES